MTGLLLFFLAHLLLVAFGAWAAFHPSLRRQGVTARLCAAFAAGAVGLAAEATLFSLLAIRWTVASLAAPLALFSLLLSIAWASRPAALTLGREDACRGTLLFAAVAVALAFSHLALWLATARATSSDYVYFWGVKAVLFAQFGGIYVPLLKWPFFWHAVPGYPPLIPIVEAWAVLFAGKMTWRGAPLTALLWLAAALPIVRACLRRRLSEEASAIVTAFWGVALALSLASSYSGGNAEAPLLFFETVAGAALLTEGMDNGLRSRFLPALALSGAALTKVEGLVGALLLAAAALWRDRLERNDRALARALPLLAAPLAAVLFWLSFQLLSGLPVGYRGHGPLFDFHLEHLGAIPAAMFRNLGAGTLGLSWIFPAGAILFLGRDRRAVLPGLLLAAGLLAFLAFDYLHDAGDPSIRIAWTLPRVTQPGLSLLILSAGIACFSPGRRSDTAARPASG